MQNLPKLSHPTLLYYYDSSGKFTTGCFTLVPIHALKVTKKLEQIDQSVFSRFLQVETSVTCAGEVVSRVCQLIRTQISAVAVVGAVAA